MRKQITKTLTSALRILTLSIAALIVAMPARAAEEEQPVDVKEAVLGHMSDAYDWHITTWAGHHISIPLPVIVKSQKDGNWHFFSSSRFGHDGKEVYEGFYIDETRQGKVYEQGFDERPWDLSITKDVVQIWINVAILLVVFLCCARWYKKRNVQDGAPGGFVGMMEVLVLAINDDVIKASIGEKHYRRYAPYLLTVFFFLLVTNLMGLVPIFPGGANVTGNITITFLFATITFLFINVFGNREYWKEIFWPDVPTWMKCPVPLMPVIELFGIFTKPFALMVRLFANMLAGHAIILSLTCIIFITFQVNALVGTSLSAVSFVMILFMDLLELLVAFIQAYVFTMLSAVFIGMSLPEHAHHKE
ncbi:MAG: F0F1 ATP synthase subunit A [Bacteroidaceae bacterium]|nr:F0F1 ATP synthase subunit A [Bacteroidaceae bacterium]